MANETKINYQKQCDELVAVLPKDPKPTLLLHVCCGPCSCYPLTYLCSHFRVTVYYANSNIYPSSEYQKRLEELKKVLRIMKEQGNEIDLVVAPYENEAYTEKLSPFKDDPEGGRRCFLCYSLRMEESYQYAEDHGFDFFTTVMSVSRQKDSQKFNQIGATLQEKHPSVRYLFSDFKKNKGQEIGATLAKEYGLYRQNYCGCLYSYEEMKARTAAQQDSEKA